MQTQEGTESMLTLEYKLDGTPAQYGAMDEGIRTVQFLRNKCLRAWMDRLPEGKSFEAMSGYTAVLAQEFAFAGRLGSQARQASAGRAWAAVSRFYDNCKKQIPGKKGYPKFQQDCRSIEYKETAGWRLAPDGRHSTFESTTSASERYGSSARASSLVPGGTISRSAPLPPTPCPPSNACGLSGE